MKATYLALHSLGRLDGRATQLPLCAHSGSVLLFAE
ncbi:hypothetical protein NBRC3278_3229 [Acetobacter pasteurianus NBRC 3278]|uniref:Uncharacterized protein n=1 Tax=Acetobacter pasteurianus NBRC 3278 TaxID=1226660 RepID=A0A401X8K3_ACEPA|nr:hypothetical protein NBRC3277_3258 [Acetobacter pasteurianus NBRC 3277]GCD64136.1 hypothetical protein NBRC3278_3229 [Acetobacter pasteurianus NBRC 3278]